MTLFYENPDLSSIIPVCLLWPETNPEMIINKELRGYITGWGRVTNDLFKGIRIKLNTASNGRRCKA